MKKHIQEFHTERMDNNNTVGDCWRALVACILDLELKEVPHFMQIWIDENVRVAYRAYLKFMSKYGLIPHLLEQTEVLTFDKAIHPVIHNDEFEYYFGIGTSPRNMNHIIILKNGKMIHDTHPSKAGILNVKYWEVFIKI